ncbi:hypothetical protein AURDEDRAFT_179383 [Auricularia subglabra TFB-10046 SS5]|nr:hypothetical protein AURDEDRAFT_179383 [Auricularia subglabra TFB-10046 SS5]
MNPYQHIPGQGQYGAQPNYGGQQPSGSAYAGAAAAFAMRNALANPYAAQQQHFYQQPSWGQGMHGQPTFVTPEGYTVSSTYAPTYFQQQPQYSAPARGRGHGGRGRGSGRGWQQPSHAGPPHQQYNSQPNHYQQASSSGSSRCGHEGCAFAGSAKAVEIHKMDRHLIYPPGHSKRKGEWDADPSLNNGKPVPIPGTGIVLDTPEAIAAWIAERKKRFPTAQRVAEKKQQLEEAKARGDIVVADSERRANKRRRIELEGGDHQSGGRGRGRGRGNARGARGFGRGGQRGAAPRAPQPLPARPKQASCSASSSSDSDSDSSSESDSDMDPVRDAVSSKRPPGETAPDDAPEDIPVAAEPVLPEVSNRKPAQPQNVKRPRQPRPAPRNPFGRRPSLLRNLLMPEIRSTVSNLSQAIRFVVQNDFFDGVELKPGDADQRLVEIIEEPESAPAQPTTGGMQHGIKTETEPDSGSSEPRDV